MRIVVSASDDLPLYRQIMRQITGAIAGGSLKPREKLLSHRELSEQLVIAPLTVKKAYDELEALGYIETQRGRGTFVCARLPRANRGDQRDRMRQLARDLLLQAHLAGVDLAGAVKILTEVEEEVAGKKEER